MEYIGELPLLSVSMHALTMCVQCVNGLEQFIHAERISKLAATQQAQDLLSGVHYKFAYSSHFANTREAKH